MTRRNTCPGCSHVIAAGAWWCGPCGSRMPSRLREAVTQAAAITAAEKQLGPNAKNEDLRIRAAEIASKGIPA